nr:uncharacterized protein LOC108076927 isoform X1 [Drosophila kikkawai]
MQVAKMRGREINGCWGVGMPLSEESEPRCIFQHFRFDFTFQTKWPADVLPPSAARTRTWSLEVEPESESESEPEPDSGSGLSAFCNLYPYQSVLPSTNLL